MDGAGRLIIGPGAYPEAIEADAAYGAWTHSLGCIQHGHGQAENHPQSKIEERSLKSNFQCAVLNDQFPMIRSEDAGE